MGQDALLLLPERLREGGPEHILRALLRTATMREAGDAKVAGLKYHNISIIR